MKYAFVVLSIFAIWVGIILLAVFNPGIGIFLPVLGIVLTTVLFLIGFGKKS